MSFNEAVDDKQNSVVSILNLPTDVLRVVCPMLIKAGIQNNMTADFRFCLCDVLSFRATCYRFNVIVNEMLLNIPFKFSPILATNYHLALQFIKEKTAWRFSSLIMNENFCYESYIFTFLQQNKLLFTRSLSRIVLELSENNYWAIDNITNWLKEVVLKPNAEVEIVFMNSIIDITDSFIVSNMKLVKPVSQGMTVVDESMLKNISSYSNLKKLVMNGKSLRIDFLKLLPNLTSLSVGHLDMYNPDDCTNLPTFPNIAYLGFDYIIKIESTQVPFAINYGFPCLEFLQFRNYTINRKLDFTHLPDSCSVLGTRLEFFNFFFTNCLQVQVFSFILYLMIRI